MDEVYCQQSVQYCNGKFYGLENGKATKTILGIMIKSVAGSYRDMLCLSPIYNLNAKKLEKVWQNEVRVVSDIGFDVVLTMTDGHQSNLTFFNNIVSGLNLEKHRMMINNPFSTNQVSFLSFDTVHIFKNFYNNFFNYKVLDCPEFPFKEDCLCLQARFSDLNDLYDLELCKPEKKAHKLSKKNA